LSNSFVNYPNPFFPSRDDYTRIVYNLPEDAYVDLEIFTVTGEAVREIVTNVFQMAGAHDEYTWSGINGKGRQVAPGTYFCRITARYVSGNVESHRRKVAVIR